MMDGRWVWAVVLFVMAAPPLWGWTPQSQERIAEEAARLAPPDLYRQIVRHRQVFADGVRAPFGDQDAANHNQNPDGGRLDQVIESMVQTAIEAIRAPRPFHEVVYRLGIVAHYVADANNPLNTANSDPAEKRYYADFLAYLESTHPRVEAVFYGFRPRIGPAEMRQMMGETFQRGRQFYPLVGREYQRIGFQNGVRHFDDRSTAYAISALAFSHAISDIAEVLRYIWLEAGGIDTRSRLPVRGLHRLPLPRNDVAR